jgi:ADP-heptose:LPS heptosyltransferase
MKINKTDEALIMLNKTLEMKSKIKVNEILWNKSLCELKLKNIDKGYKIYKPLSRTEYEKKFLKLKELTRIEDLISNPKKVLIWGDQGYGDMIIFSRFVKYISKKYKIKINLLFPKKIKELFINFDENINLFENDETQDLDIYDFQIRLSCLPRVINYKDFNDIEFYELNLKPINSNLQKKTPNIGLAWSGRSTFSNDNLRSVPLSYFDKLLKKNFQFYKLQQEASENDIEILKKYSNITDLGSKSFFELANIIKQLDLVISCDTAIIHLAGTLNVKSYLLLNYNSHWIWFDDSKSNVWYPSVEIIKQIKMGDWSTVFQKLETNIAQLYS